MAKKKLPKMDGYGAINNMSAKDRDRLQKYAETMELAVKCLLLRGIDGGWSLQDSLFQLNAAIMSAVIHLRHDKRQSDEAKRLRSHKKRKPNAKV